MKIFPAVDILGGKCVQLVQGKRESATAYGDPLACATRWLDQGAEALHVVNLDGAFGSSAKNAELIAELIKKTDVEIELVNDSRDDRFDRESLLEQLPPKRRGEAAAMDMLETALARLHGAMGRA